MSEENTQKEEGITTPYMEPVSFDYDAYRKETTLPAIKSIYKIFADEVDNLVFDETATKESISNSHAVVVQKILETLVSNKVPDADMKFLIESFQATFYMIFNALSRQKDELEKEYLARSIGARDPGTGKFTREYASLSDLFIALENKRNEQDTEGNQYFIEKFNK